MAIALPPMDQKGKNALIIAILLLAGVGAYWYLLYAPDQVEIKTIAAHADTLDARNTRDSLDVANGLEAKLRADGERYSNELSGLRQLVPTAAQVPALLQSVSENARRVGLEVSEFSQDGVITGDFFDMNKYRFGVIGPYHKVAEFLTMVASSPRIITPVNVSIGPSSGTVERRPRPNETFVELKFGIITYVAKTQPAGSIIGPAIVAPATPAKPGAK